MANKQKLLRCRTCGNLILLGRPNVCVNCKFTFCEPESCQVEGTEAEAAMKGDSHDED